MHSNLASASGRRRKGSNSANRFQNPPLYMYYTVFVITLINTMMFPLAFTIRPSLKVIDLARRGTGIISSASLLSASTPETTHDDQNAQPTNSVLVKIPETTWRESASQHRQQVYTLLQNGLTSPDDQRNTGLRRKGQLPPKNHSENETDAYFFKMWTALDPKNPVYNFLIEYYGLKGVKGPKRLSRWSPDPLLLLLLDLNDDDNDSDKHDAKDALVSSLVYHYEGLQVIHNGNTLIQWSDPLRSSSNKNKSKTKTLIKDLDRLSQAAMDASNGRGGILLENATLDDFSQTLHLRGATPITIPTISESMKETAINGVLYNPELYYNSKAASSSSSKDDEEEERLQLQKMKAPFQWYKSILQTTLNSEPILHCHGLHEWAMQYYPGVNKKINVNDKNAQEEAPPPPPPSSKYQAHLPLRVSYETINKTVERKGIHCTHVDALRFFAPEAGPLNHHGDTLQRTDQLRLEQKGCVHAHMDLLKMALKLQPFVDSKLLCDVLQISLESRILDVEASPYDVSSYEGLSAVKVETSEGRKIYRERQRNLMSKAEVVRKKLLGAYDTLLHLGFGDDMIIDGSDTNYNVEREGGEGEDVFIAKERYAKAEPGGLPWRQNLVPKSPPETSKV